MTEVERAGEQPGEAQSETGTPVRGPGATTGGTDPTGAAADGGRGRRRITELAVVAAVAYALDLITKIVVVEKLEGHDPIEVIGTWLRFQAVRNPGAAFGIGEALTVVFTVIAAAVIVVIVRIARKLYSTPWAVALGLLLGGALGNLTDRVFRSPGMFQGHVVDFIAPAHFAVFNLADSAIVCGGVLIVLLSFRGLDPDGSVHRD
ncbi:MULTISPECIES: signal peptidase II [Streptomyces]|uniref:Lipoprotein signal peptidase n=1 Tax=Streptomyces desertarenae TaxID=2666184 RepID=A0ABW4PPS5_9ACTN